MRRSAVFLDRDGVINRSLVRDGKPYAPRRLADFRLLPGVTRAVDKLRAAGFLIVVVTNQPDIGNDLVDAPIVDAMHARLRAKIRIDSIMVCPHRQDAGCACRKPKPGMLLGAAARYDVDLGASYMIGDRYKDVEAGRHAGCRTVWIRVTGQDSREPSGPADYEAPTLAEAAAWILRRAVAPGPPGNDDILRSI